jgi:hypothetical protein
MKITDALNTAFKSVATEHKKQKKQTDKSDRLSKKQLEDLRRNTHTITVKDAAYRVMQQAYMHASANNTLPANARQIMYAARPLVLSITGGELWKHSSYFTQHLLPDFIDDYPSLTDDWDVVYDARGKLTEPHTGERVDLGTLAVRRYIRDWTNGNDSLFELDDLPHRVETVGPANRYKHVLFIEKEGFNELFSAVRLSEKYDLPIMSTKGMSVTAARHLVQALSEQDVTILVLHDFDKAGFSIIGTLKYDTRRWSYDVTPLVTDLGLRLTDVEEMGLQSEEVTYRGSTDPRWNLKVNGATEEECNFLVRNKYYGSWDGQRVELNAMASNQLVIWLETKLQDIGVTKIIPSEKILAKAYRRAYRIAIAQRAMNEALEKIESGDILIPDNLADRVKDDLQETSDSWDDIIFELATDNLEAAR